MRDFRAQHDMINDLRKGHRRRYAVLGIFTPREMINQHRRNSLCLSQAVACKYCQTFFISMSVFARFILSCMSSSGSLFFSFASLSILQQNKRNYEQFSVLFKERARGGDFCLHSKWDIFMRFKLGAADAFHHLASAFSDGIILMAFTARSLSLDYFYDSR